MSSFGESVSSSIDDVYFGSRRVYFRQVPGSVIAVNDIATWSPLTTEEAKRKVLHRLEKHYVEGSEHPVVVPGIPALDFTHGSQPSGTEDVILSEGQFLSKPVIKCLEQENTFTDGIAVASGRRSALLKSKNGTWYRLKGCGNNDEGFPIRLSRDADSTWQDVRGSAFPHTAVSMK
jgi:hypothetical protein